MPQVRSRPRGSWSGTGGAPWRHADRALGELADRRAAQRQGGPRVFPDLCEGWQLLQGELRAQLDGVYLEARIRARGTNDVRFCPRWCRPVVVAIGVVLQVSSFAPAFAACTGDCDGDGRVAIEELITGVSIALGHLPTELCQPIDRSGDGRAGIEDLVGAVGSALNDCPRTPTSPPTNTLSPTATASPTPSLLPTPTPTPTQSGNPTISRTPTGTPTRTATPDSGTIATPTRTRTATPTPSTTSKATRVPTASRLFRDVALSTQAAVRVAVESSDHLDLLHHTIVLSQSDCTIGGGAEIGCEAGDGRATRTIVYSDCRSSTAHGNVVRLDGVVVQTLPDCDGADDPSAVELQNLRIEERSQSIDPVLSLIADLRITIAHSGRRGCAGLDSEERFDGTVRVSCTREAKTISCPEDGLDVILEATGLAQERLSLGEPCRQFATSMGTLTVRNLAEGEEFTQLFEGLTIGRNPAADGDGDEVRIDGELSVDCIGTMKFATKSSSPIRVVAGSRCPTGGEISVGRPGSVGAAASQDARTATENSIVYGAQQAPGGGLRHSLHRAADGRVYQVIQNDDDANGADALRLTSLVGSLGNAVALCSNTAGEGASPMAVAVARGGSAFPLESVVRSGILSGTTPPCFNRNAEAGSGRVCIGPACTADCGCSDGADCRTFTLSDGTGLDQADPPAHLVEVGTSCGNFPSRETFAFGAGGPTVERPLCGPAPQDGIELPVGATLIVAYDTQPLELFNAGVAGLPIDEDGMNSLCPGPGVLSPGRTESDTAAAPSVRFSAEKGALADYDGDGVGDETLASCAARVRIECEEPKNPTPTPTPDVERPCAAVLLESALRIEREGSTNDRANSAGEAGCGWGGGSKGPDQVFEYVAPATGTYDIAVEADGFTPFLYIRRENCLPTQAELACDDDAEGAERAAVTPELAKDQRIAIVVDGASAAGGDFELTVALRRPDLTVAPNGISVPERATIGEEISVGIRVDNDDVGVASEFEVEIRFDGGTLTTFSCEGIAPHAFRICGPVRLAIPLDGTAQSQLTAIVDASGALDESDESNNQASVPIEVRPVLSFLPEHVELPTLRGLAVLALSPDPQVANLYAASPERSTLSVFARDAQSGRITFVDAYSQAEDGIGALASVGSLVISSDGAFVYAGRALFRRDSHSGVLTFLPGLEGAGGTSAVISPDPNGAHLYAATPAGLAVYRRDPVTGALTPVDTETDGDACSQCLDALSAIAISPDGAHVYAANACSASISVFVRNPDTGALTFVPPVQRDGVGGVDGLEFVSSVALSADGRHLYATGAYEDSVAVFVRDPASGQITQVEVVRAEGLDFPSFLALSRDADGRNLFVAAANDDAVTVLQRDRETGTLSLVESQADGARGVEGLDFVGSLAVTPDGLFLYAAGADDGSIAAFRINR